MQSVQELYYAINSLSYSLIPLLWSLLSILQNIAIHFINLLQYRLRGP